MIALTAVLVTAATPSFAQPQHFRAISRAPVAVRNAHSREVERLRCGDQRVEHPPQFDRWHAIDLDGDGQREYLAFFTLEGFGGGNNYVRYLTVYRYIEPVWITASTIMAGGRGYADVSGATVRLDGSTLSTQAMLYANGDGMCCPTIQTRVEFTVGVGGSLAPRSFAISDRAAAYGMAGAIVSRCPRD